jgi:hypothetical protein
MTEKEIEAFIRKRDALQKKADAIHEQRKELLDTCTHPQQFITKKHKSNTGNWCPDDDHYWTEFYCDLCKQH